ncbi:hypothetical protein ACOMHN_030171 [Nucella lapillus]
MLTTTVPRSGDKRNVMSSRAHARHSIILYSSKMPVFGVKPIWHMRGIDSLMSQVVANACVKCHVMKSYSRAWGGGGCHVSTARAVCLVSSHRDTQRAWLSSHRGT